MDIVQGLTLTDPDAFIPWETTKGTLSVLVVPHTLRCTDTTCYLADGRSGLSDMIGIDFRFNRSDDDQGFLQEIEIARTIDTRKMYSLEQGDARLSALFGIWKEKDDHGLISHYWTQGDVAISHYILDRFTLEEHIVVAKNR